MTKLIKVAGVQMDVTLGDAERNLKHLENALRQTAAADAELTVFPECALTGYCYQSLEEAQANAESIPGPWTDRLEKLCQELKTWLITGILESYKNRVYNTAVLVGPNGVVATYRKVHLPYLGVDRFVTPGEISPGVYECGNLRVGMHICYDGSFPEAARCMAVEGADLITLPTNWPPGAEYMAKYLINARAVENHVYFLSVNRVGTERGFQFIGKSRLCRPNGSIAAEIDNDHPGIFYGEIDLEAVRNKHLVRIPGEHEIDRLADRRPDTYEKLILPPVDQTPRVRHRLENQESPGNQLAHPPENDLYAQLWAPWRLAYVTGDKDKSKPKPKPLEEGPSTEEAKSTEKPSPEASKSEPPEEPTKTEPETNFILEADKSERDRENLVIKRTEHTITILNRYPYNNGHLLVAPRVMKADLSELTPEEHLECMQTLSEMMGRIRKLMKPDGFNIGLNLGRSAGAGLPGHLHWHLVPRWNGDTNFMPVLDGVRVIPQSLDALWQYLTEDIREGRGER
ncbi:Hypothetical protein PBC10988_20170 [Planctomycetales bacterium 10988]|nr:Hypothetical protein PBC10988_20170 [Planctomycetales bacterium 10988]